MERTKKSKALYEEARKILPGGASSQGKCRKPYPIYIKGGKGSKFVDIDGNEYIDWLMSAGAGILGHAHPAVVEAIKKQLEWGTNHFIATELEVEHAKIITRHMPHIEMIRYVNSGTEAMLQTVRTARAYKKKDKIAKFEGHFHGTNADVLLVSSGFGATEIGMEWGPPERPNPVADTPGITKALLDTVVVLPPDKLEATLAILKEHANELAGVVMSGSPGLPLNKEFMKAIREFTEERDIPLIFDEVVSGFRLALGGMAEYYGVIPDLCGLGKIIGGMLPMGAFGGRADIMTYCHSPPMDLLDKRKRIIQSGTFSGNPISIAAGISTLKEVEKGKVIPYVESVGRSLKKGWEEISSDLGINVYYLPLQPNYSFNTISFESDLPTNLRARAKVNRKKRGLLTLGMMTKGIFAPYNVMSSAHTKEDIEQTLAAGRDILKEMKSRNEL